MKVTLGVIGKCKANSPEGEIIKRYEERMKWSLSIKEKDNSNQIDEAKFLKSCIGNGAKVVVLDERGKNMTSPELAQIVEGWMNNGCSEICFLIGGADGHLEETRKSADLVLSFGKLTLPHILMRAVLAEQIYRIETIIKRTAQILQFKIDDFAALEIAQRSRCTPRIANRLVKRCADWAIVKADGIITKEIVMDALNALDIDELGLDITDRNMLKLMIESFNGGPVGIETLAVALGEDIRTIEDVYEPYLIQKGFISRAPRGRKVTKLAYQHLGLKIDISQMSLFE